MATVLWIPWPETGHVLATLKIATSLRQRGHHVVYLGVPVIEEMITRRGLDFVRILETSFPDGFLGWPGGGETKVRQSFVARWRERRRRMRELIDVLFGDAGVRLLEQVKPDIVATDALLPSMALQAYKLGIPAALVCTTMPQHRRPAIPPLTSGIIPRKTLASRGLVAFSWSWHRATRNLGRTLGSLLGETINSDPLMKRLAHGAAYPMDRTMFQTTFEPTLAFPELITAPEGFDFASGPGVNQYYVESVEEGEVAVQPFPWDRLPHGKPLVHISLGSQSHQLGDEARRFFRVAVQTMAERPSYHAVVAVGSAMPKEELEPLPDNVTVVPWAPDMDILQNASFMITHAGLGSVKKCLYHGVPMIAFPCMRDQFGNAARIVHHGLGVRGDIVRVSTQRLLALIRAIEEEPLYRTRAEAFKVRFREMEDAGRGGLLLEQWMGASAGDVRR